MIGTLGATLDAMPVPPTRCVAKPLTAEKFDLAFPLIQLLAPALTLEPWREFAGAMTDSMSALPGHHGIVVLEDAAGYVFGLFSYTDGLDPMHGPTLRVENLVVPHFVEGREATGLMEREMHDIARRLDCRAIVVHLTPPPGTEPRHGMARHLKATDYRVEGTVWWRILPATPAP